MSNIASTLSLQSKTPDKHISGNRVQQARHFGSDTPVRQGNLASPVKFAFNPEKIDPSIGTESDEQALLSHVETEQTPQLLNTHIPSEPILTNQKGMEQDATRSALFPANTHIKRADSEEAMTLATTDRNLYSKANLHQLVSGESVSKTPAAISSGESTSNQMIQNPLLNSVSAVSGTVAITAQGQTQAQPLGIDTPAFNSPPAQGPEWASVKIDTNAGKWGEQMMQVLHDRVSLQANQNVQEARIRLDPPELGKLDLMVRVEGDRLNVQINANTVATREALVQISDRLRTELQNQNFVHVDVNVGSGESDQHQSSHHNEQDQEPHIFASRNFSTDINTPSQSDRWLSTQA